MIPGLVHFKYEIYVVVVVARICCFVAMAHRQRHIALQNNRLLS